MMRKPILCADGTIISVQASSTHYCSPKSDEAFAYSAVEVLIDKPNDPVGYNRTDKVLTWVIPETLMELIKEHGGIIGGQLPPLDFGNHQLVDSAQLNIANEGNAWWEERQVEKQAEEAQERTRYLLEKEQVAGLDKAELYELTFGSEEE